MAQLKSSTIYGDLRVTGNTTLNEGLYVGSIYLEEDANSSYYLRLLNNSGATANRTLTINTNNADRTISLSGDLTVSSAATISGTNTGDQTNISGNAATATALQTARTINGVSFNGTANITITASTTNGLVLNNSGSGAASGTTFTGGSAVTLSYNTIGAQVAHSNLTSLSGLTYASASFVKMTGANTFALDTNTYSVSTHTHGNITNAGAIGSTANLPVITTTSGVLTTGSFGTAANTFCQGNDSRLSDARTPTSHTHGNITNAGAIGSTSGLVVITTTSGVLTTLAAGSSGQYLTYNGTWATPPDTNTTYSAGTGLTLATTTFSVNYGTTAGTACQGNDSRLSDARTPTSHDLTTHTVSGLTTGHFLKATGASSFGFAAHGLTASDVGAAPTAGSSSITTVGTVTSGTWSAGGLTATLTDAGTNTILYPLVLDRQSSGTPANGIGTGIQFKTETAAGNTEIGGVIECVATDVTATSEDFDIVFKTMAAGAAATEAFRVFSDNKVKIGGYSTLANNGTNAVAIVLPAAAGTLVGSGDTGTVTNTMLAGSIANSKLANSTISGIALGSNLATLTIGTGLSGTSYNGSSAVTISIDSTVATLTGSQALTNKTYNGLTVTSSTGTLTIAAAKTLTVNNTLTFSGTDSSTLNIGTGGTLGTAAYTASTAYATSGHTHGNITNAGAIGSTSGLVVVTTTSGVLTTLAAGSSGQYLTYNGTWATPPDTNTTYSAGTGLTLATTTFSVNYGTTAGTACQGNDSRLSDARTPTSHALTTHTVSGLTTGHFLKATGASSFGFAAHGLTASDVGAAPTAGSASLVTVGTVTSGTWNAGGLTATLTDAGTNTVLYPLVLDRQSSGTPANGIGTGIQFKTETAAGNTEIGSLIESVTTDVTATSEDFDIVFKTMAAGAAATEAFRITSDNKVKIGGYSTLANNGTSTVAIVLPSSAGTLVGSGDTGTVTNTMLAGSIANAKLANSTISGIALGSNLATLTISSPLSGTSYNGSGAVSIGLASNYGDTQNPYASKTANYFLAAPNGSAGAPSFRAIVAADIPTLNQNTTGSSGSCTGNAASSTYASAVTLTADNTTNATNYLLFSSTATGNVSPRTDTGLTYNPSTGIITSTGFSGSGSSLTSLTAGNLSGTIPSAVLGNSSVYIGTTAVALNRGTGALTLAGVSLSTLTISTGLSGTSYNGSSAVTISVNYGTTAGTACQGNDSRLSDARTPTSHTHGNITNAGAIGSTANLPVITTTSGVLTTGSFGTTANTFCQGNDSRLSDARTPTSHDLTTHTVSGLTTGHFLKATGASSFGFAAHGLTASDVGAAPTAGSSSITTVGTVTSGNWSSTLTSTDDTTTNATYYPLITTAASTGTIKISSTKLSFNPSTGQLSSTSFNATSKREYKENIMKVEYSALDILKDVDIVSFNYKEDAEKNYRVGFIADDTHEYLSGKKHDTMDLPNTIGLLIKAVQELKKENEELKKRLDNGF